MKLKIAITVLILSCCAFFADGKWVFTVIVSPLPDSTVSGISYYTISSGASILMNGTMFHTPNYYYPTDSVHWYRDGSFFGTTLGNQTIGITQSGIYNAIGYDDGSVWWTPIPNIVYSITVLNPTGIAQNTNPQLLITQHTNGHSLLVSGLSESINHRLEIFSLTGSVVKRETIPAHTKEYVISLAAIKRGYYIINISDNAGNFSRKLFVE